MKKFIILPIFLLLISNLYLQAQVKFSINLLPDQETYLVSLIPDEDINAPLNAASNIQIVFKIPMDKPFLAGEITSQIEGITWIDNAFSHAESGGTDYALCAITMAEASTKKLQFQEGVELPLFTFKNLESGCVGAIIIPENTDEEVKRAVARGYNFTQNITLLAARGNGYSGVINKVADCAELSTSISEEPIVSALKAYPVPVNKNLVIEWSNIASYKDLQLEVVNSLGQIMLEKALDGSIGFKNTQLNVENYSAGLYHFRISNELGNSQQYKFIVVDKK